MNSSEVYVWIDDFAFSEWFVCFRDRLADLANFHLQMTKAYNLTEENKWISFGGSYPGSLSAWFRIKVLIIKVNL